jgi:hypothetical protein
MQLLGLGGEPAHKFLCVESPSHTGTVDNACTSDSSHCKATTTCSSHNAIFGSRGGGVGGGLTGTFNQVQGDTADSRPSHIDLG